MLSLLDEDDPNIKKDELKDNGFNILDSSNFTNDNVK